ncbi:enoyl-CoA hydratase-related protein [Marinobacterium rhizophilum]|uniref:Crotonobetainyl-CoA hydratase n=1 Tax=Marinobacterium rhizophilum TaxID=420402 RepID=A0ABY5HKL2_9GAMM|nr:enoyl-CoA hydratase-related protein [Marinobacterium rhizophilum]UTW12337.1 crotonobetainyl-CoA hydratase [Marinobacterium rhizophilum]
MTDNLNVTRNGQILEIVLNRPKGNAIDAKLSRRMGEVFASFRDDPELRVAILTGAGEKFFCGGWDLNAVADGEEYTGDFGEGGFGGFPEMDNLLKPVICAVNGYALGAGFEMLLNADFVVASDNAQFWLPEAQVGVAPDIATFLLPKIMPRVKAMELLLTGKRLSAEDAAGLGLVNSVVPQAQLLDHARELAHRIMKSAPLSVAAIKEVVRETETLSFADCYRDLRAGKWPEFEKMLASDDATEGAKAFQDRRDPAWKGC